MYKTEDFGVFIGMMTMPFGKENDFVKYEVRTLFEEHKRNIEKHLLNAQDGSPGKLPEELYVPRCYVMFGSFDLFAIALVDDLTLATRSFHPFSPLIEDKLNEDRQAGHTEYELRNYAYRVISGLVPHAETIGGGESPLLDKARNVLLSPGETPYPLVSITSFKLNNALLIGSGGGLLELTLSKVRGILQEDCADAVNLNYFLLHSFGWEEVYVVLFSDSYSWMTEKLFEIREMIFQDLEEIDGAKAKRLLKESLLYQFSRGESGAGLEEMRSAHLFVHTQSTFGFDFEQWQNQQPLRLADEGALQLVTRWRIKPGHLRSFIEELAGYSKNLQDFRGLITIGQGDYTIELQDGAMGKLKELVEIIIDENLKKHVRKLRTFPGLPDGFKREKGRKVDLQSHFLFHDFLPRFEFKIDRIRHLRDNLRQLGVSKIVREKIGSMFTIFNDGIVDPVLYGYFIELKPFLEEVLEIVRKLLDQPGEQSVQNCTNQLLEAASLFEFGYKNRFGQSYIMSEITDYDIEFNGGIQQLITAYDGAYKSLANLLDEDEYGKSIVYAAGYPSIRSHILGVRVNYYHLYQPEFFAAAAVHEAANFYQERRFLRPEDFKFSRGFDDEPEMYQGESPSFEERSALRYFTTDLASYYLAYLQDFNLYFYWHWCTFFQEAYAYNRDGTVNRDQFNRFFARMYLIDLFVHDESKRKMEDPDVLPIRLSDPSLFDIWKQAFAASAEGEETIPGRVRAIYEKFAGSFREKADEIIGYEVKEYFRSLTDTERLLDAVAAIQEDPEKYEIVSDLFSGIAPGPELDDATEEAIYIALRTSRIRVMQKIAGEIIDSFKRKEVYCFDDGRYQPYFVGAHLSMTYQTLFFAYLKLLMELNNGCADILARKPLTREIARQKDHKTNHLLVDSFGGMFSISPGVEEKVLPIQNTALENAVEHFNKKENPAVRNYFLTLPWSSDSLKSNIPAFFHTLMSLGLL